MDGTTICGTENGDLHNNFVMQLRTETAKLLAPDVGGSVIQITRGRTTSATTGVILKPPEPSPLLASAAIQSKRANVIDDGRLDVETLHGGQQSQPTIYVISLNYMADSAGTAEPTKPTRWTI